MSDKKVVFLLFILVFIFGIGYGVIKSAAFGDELYYVNEHEPSAKTQKLNALTPEQKEKAELPQYLILYDEKEEGSVTLKDNVAQTLRYMKKTYEESSSMTVQQLTSDIQAIFITFEDIDQFTDWPLLFQYVQQGGRLIFLERSVPGEQFEVYKKQMGIKSCQEFEITEGFHILEGLLIDKDGFNESDSFIENSSLKVQLEEKTEVYAVSNEQEPLLWLKKEGEGSIVYFNGTMMGQPTNRGLIPSIMALGGEPLIYPIINAEVLFIDDCSSPIPPGTIKAGKDQVEMSIDQFYKTKWWPDLLSTAQSFGLKYSGMIIENYNDQVEGKFEDSDPTAAEALRYFSRELLSNGYEMGYHGYNHQSLTEDQAISDAFGYRAWTSMENVEAALKELTRFTSSILPDYDFRSYVAPSNVLSQSIRDQFPTLMPQVKVISSLYPTGYEGEAYTQEFETAADGVVEFPRISSGYAPDASERWSLYNGVSLHGVVSHFIHPDDVLDQARGGGKSWEELYKCYDDLLSEVNKDYSWLRPMTISEAAQALQEYEDAEVYFEQDEKGLRGYCDGFSGELYFILKSSKKPTGKKCSCEQLDQETYLIYTTEPAFEIIWEGENAA